MEASQINELLDILIDENVKKRDKTTPYYKLYATQEAARHLLAFEMSCLVEKLLDFNGIARFKFEFNHEYNDEGGTYLSVSGELTYEKKVGDKNLHEPITFYSGGYSGCGDEFFDEDILKQFSEEEQNRLIDAIDELSNHMSDLTTEDVEDAYKFYDASMTKENIRSLYREAFPEACARIEKYLIEGGIGDKMENSENRTPYKM